MKGLLSPPPPLSIFSLSFLQMEGENGQRFETLAQVTPLVTSFAFHSLFQYDHDREWVALIQCSKWMQYFDKKNLSMQTNQQPASSDTGLLTEHGQMCVR